MVRQVAGGEVEERFVALLSNAAAVRAVAAVVEGTLGPKGLDCMLVDRFGDVTITNDGSTILDKIDAQHPAARLLISGAQAQDREVGDGTTTATVLASALITQAVTHAGRGVPITKLVEGIRLGISTAVAGLQRRARPIAGLDDPLLRDTAVIAARGDQGIADLAVDAARRVGADTLKDPTYRLADWVVAKEGAKDETFGGVIVDQEPVNVQMPRSLQNVRVLLLDDPLEPEPLDGQAMGTEIGFRRYMELQDEFRKWLDTLQSAGIGLVASTKAVAGEAEERLTQAGIIATRRLSLREMERLAENTGARILKRGSLKRPLAELTQFLGTAADVSADQELDLLRVTGAGPRPAATILVGAATRQVRDERERIAVDAAWAVQQTVKGGVLVGEGAAALAVVPEVETVKSKAGGMVSYGVDCVIEALKTPISRILANAGFNPLEKLEEATRAQREHGDTWGIDTDSGEPTDMAADHVFDPAPVMIYALRTAGEVAEAILRINTIIKKREVALTGPPPPPPPA